MKAKFFLFIILLSAFASCKKEPGLGGDASIRGQIWAKDYNTSFTTLIGEYPAEDEYVYIVFGDHDGFDKRIKTDYEGKFIFDYLYQGEYTIYSYSADSTLTQLDGTIPVIQNVKIESRKQDIDLGKITIAK